MSDEKEQDLSPSPKNTLRSVLTRERKNISSKIIEDIAVIKHVKPILNKGSSIAVELTGLSDSDLNELIRATNTAYRKSKDNSKDIPDSLDPEEIDAEVESMIVQGD